MSELLSVPQKKGEGTDLARALRSFLQAAASDADAPVEWTGAAAQLANMRTAALRSSDAPSEQLAHLTRSL